MVITSTGASFVNNTVIRNVATGDSSSQGAGILAYPGTTISGKNNICFLNTGGTNPNVYGTANFTYCNVEGGLAGTGNINVNPMFVNTPPSGYFFLSQIAAGQTQNSPCVNAGDPTSQMVTGSTRTDLVQDAGTVDMGYHWTYPLAAVDGLDLGEETLPEGDIPATPSSPKLILRNVPNPFNPITSISFSLPQAERVTLDVFDVAGQRVASLVDGWLSAGEQKVAFDGSSLVSGVYIYHLTANDDYQTGKMVLVK